MKSACIWLNMQDVWDQMTDWLSKSETVNVFENKIWNDLRNFPCCVVKEQNDSWVQVFEWVEVLTKKEFLEMKTVCYSAGSEDGISSFAWTLFTSRSYIFQNSSHAGHILFAKCSRQKQIIHQTTLLVVKLIFSVNQ